jgi:hypothetical protein
MSAVEQASLAGLRSEAAGQTWLAIRRHPILDVDQLVSFAAGAIFRRA